MKIQETQINCQIPCFRSLAEGIAEVPPESFIRRMKLRIRRILSPNKERSFKNYTNDWMNRFCKLVGGSPKPSVSKPNITSETLHAGDWVRVRLLEEIETTLNHWIQVRGCSFMPEMADYCGTIHRVLSK